MLEMFNYKKEALDYVKRFDPNSKSKEEIQKEIDLKQEASRYSNPFVSWDLSVHSAIISISIFIVSFLLIVILNMGKEFSTTELTFLEEVINRTAISLYPFLILCGSCVLLYSVFNRTIVYRAIANELKNYL